MSGLIAAAPGAAEWTLIVVSPFVGSFVGSVIRRLPEGRPVLWGRSRCEHCGRGLGARDLMPLTSWLLARGRCRHCRVRVGWFYPAVEVAAVAAALISVTVDRGAAAWLDALLGWWLLALGWIDLRRWLLPDALTLPLLLAGLAATAWRTPDRLLDSLLGALGGYAVLWAVAAGYRRLRHREGIGMGDAKLLAAGGAWVGATGLPGAVLVAAIAALAAAGIIVVTGRRLDRFSALPFGTFLAPAIWWVALFGAVRF